MVTEKLECRLCKSKKNLRKGGKAPNHPEIQRYICQLCIKKHWLRFGKALRERKKNNPVWAAQHNLDRRKYYKKFKK